MLRNIYIYAWLICMFVYHNIYIYIENREDFVFSHSFLKTKSARLWLQSFWAPCSWPLLDVAPWTTLQNLDALLKRFGDRNPINDVVVIHQSTKWLLFHICVVLCIYVYMYVYIYIYIYVCIHVCIAVLLLSQSEQCALFAFIFYFMDASCASTCTNELIYIPSGKLT